MHLAGLDVGTTGCKVTVYNQDGAYLGGAYEAYPVRRSPSAHEVDAGDIWAAAQEVIRQTAEQYGIDGIGVTSFGETFVLLDEEDRPLLPSMLYTDPRGGEECVLLTEKLGEPFLIETTGLAPHPMYGLPKLMWVKAHRPREFSKAVRCMQMEDYIVYKLTGTAQIDYSLATRTMGFDIGGLCWSEAVFRAAGIDSSLLSKPVPIGTPAGKVRPELARGLGLSGEVAVLSVSQDQVAAAIGSGVFDGARTVDGAGTVECMTPVFRTYDPYKMAAGGYAIVPYLAGQYVSYAFSYTGGALVKWFVDQLAGYAAKAAQEQGTRIYDQLEGDWDGTPTGILVLPHFAGAATPYMDAGSKGAIVGLSLSHTQQDLHLAMMEGVCYEMRLNLEQLRQSGVEIAPLRATGGGANSRVWMQMKADILGLPVTSLRVSEAGTTGSAMLVGLNAGIFQSLQEAAAVMIAEKETFIPRPEATALYDACFQKYKALYSAVRPLM